MTPNTDTRRRKWIGTLMLLCTFAAVYVTWTVEGTWVFIGCAVFLVATAIFLPRLIPRSND